MTTEEKHEQACKRAHIMLRELQRAVGRARMNLDPDWGDIGTMNHVCERLKEIHDFLTTQPLKPRSAEAHP